jgi:predicted dehydrogenase
MNRRTFLHSAMGAGLTLTSSTPAPSQGDAKRTLNVALLGAGAQGETLLEACIRLGAGSGVRFRAVCDIWEDLTLSRLVRLLERYGHPANGYVDYRAMLEGEKDLDAVLVATPDFCHAEQTVACLKAGLHVYCEAPVSNTAEGARSMVEAARETGRLLQIGHQRRSNPRYVHCRDELVRTARLLGRMVAIDAQWNRPARADRGWSRRREMDPAILEKYGYASMHQFRNWMWYKGLGAGPAVDFGAHQIDVINWFLGASPNAVTARGGTYYYDPETHQWPDTVMAVLDYETEDGPLAVSYRNLSANGYGGHVEVFMGDEGTLELSESADRGGAYRDPEAPDWDKWVRLDFLARPGMTETEDGGAGVLDVQETKPPSRYDVPVTVEVPYHQPHLVNFFDAVRGTARLNCPAEAAVAATVAALKLNEAVERKQSVALSADDLAV